MEKTKAGLGVAFLGVAVALGAWLAPPDSLTYGVKFGLILFAIILCITGVGLLISACWPLKISKTKTAATNMLSQFGLTFGIQDVDDSIKACACTIRNKTSTAQDIKRYFAISKAGNREVVSALMVVSKAKHENQARENLRLLGSDASAFYVVTFSRLQRKAFIHDRAYELPVGEYLITLRFLVDGQAIEAENMIRVTSSLPYIEWVLPDDKVKMQPIPDIQELLR